MSTNTSQKFEEIIMYLSIFRYMVRSNGKIGYLNIHKASEGFFCAILNIVYDYNLKNLNHISKNSPAIDLGDKDKKICFQITAENSSQKIEETIEKFKKNDLSKVYKELRILLLTTKSNYSKKFDLTTPIVFKRSEHIIDIDDVLCEVEKLLPEKLIELHNYLEKELPSIRAVLAKKGSILARAQKTPDSLAKNGQRLLEDMGYKKTEFLDAKNTLDKAYLKLKRLSEEEAAILYQIILHGDVETGRGGDKIIINARHLTEKTGIPEHVGFDYVTRLEHYRMASLDSEDGQHFVEVSLRIKDGADLFCALKSFASSDAMLQKLIVDRDFTLLDE